MRIGPGQWGTGKGGSTVVNPDTMLESAIRIGRQLAREGETGVRELEHDLGFAAKIDIADRVVQVFAWMHTQNRYVLSRSGRF